MIRAVYSVCIVNCVALLHAAAVRTAQLHVIATSPYTMMGNLSPYTIK
jgi:hypothetical protein